MSADTVVYADVVRTVDEETPTAEAFAVVGDRFCAVGTAADVEPLVGPETTVLDFAGKTVVPGFVDPHCHMSARGRALLRVDLGPDRVASMDDLVDVLAERATETPAGEWVLGVGYDETAVGRHPTREVLDRASTDHPIYVRHVSAHVGAANTAALDRLDRDALDGVDPEHVERDADGDLTGVFREDPHYRIEGTFGQGLFPPPSREDDQRALREICARYNAVGITSVHDALVTPSQIRMYRDGAARGTLTVRSYLMVWHEFTERFADLELASGFGGEMVRLGPAKNIVDGAIAARTALLRDPYADRPDYRGDRRVTQNDLDAMVREAHEAGFQVAVHANGDRAIEMLLDAYEAALSDAPRVDHRHRVEHATVVDDALLDRIADLGLVVTPFSTYLYQHGDHGGAYGDRLERMYPHGSALSRGVPVAGASDHPAGLLDPLLAIRTLVTRRTAAGEVVGPDERVSVADALRIYTLNGAYAAFEEDLKGSITPGKLADFVVLSDDPFAVPPERIHDLDVERTYLGGRCVHPR